MTAPETTLTEVFGADYFLRGPETGLSNYENYRWMPNLTREFADRVKRHLHIGPGDSVLDFGCARGYLVKALRHLQVDAWGYDVSKWAVANCDPEVREFVSWQWPRCTYSHVFAKDVLEHVLEEDLAYTVRQLHRLARWQMFFIVPLTTTVGGKYVRPEDEADTTHQIRWPLSTWWGFFNEHLPGPVWASYHVEGLKPASKLAPGSTGFFRIEIQ